MNYKSEGGQAMVEFALVLPIFFLIIGGIIDFGWIFHHQTIANNACREGARYAAIHSSEPGYDVNVTENIVKGYFNNFGVDDNVTVSTEADNIISVSVSYNVDILTPFTPLIIDGDGDGKYIVSAQTKMRKE